MSLPTPRVGQVLRDSYRWANERRHDDQAGSKDRPVAVVVCTRTKADETVVGVCPITHHPQVDDATIEIPSRDRKRLGLDDERHWLVASEINRFIWPRPDLRRRPDDGTFRYGMLPAHLYEQLRTKLLELIKTRWLRHVTRD